MDAHDQHNQHHTQLTISPVQFGMMIAQLAQLNAQLPNVVTRVEELERLYQGVNQRFRIGWVGLVMFVLGIGCAILGAKEAVKIAWKLITGDS